MLAMQVEQDLSHAGQKAFTWALAIVLSRVSYATQLTAKEPRMHMSVPPSPPGVEVEAVA